MLKRKIAIRAGLAIVLVAIFTVLFSRYVLSRKSSPPFGSLNVVFIAIDALHAKHLGAWTPELRNSPNIDALAHGGAAFMNAYAVTSWTKPSFASMFTSVLPSHHGATGIRSVLPGEFKTLAEQFKESGFRTAGFISHSPLDASYGISQGFDEYTRINQGGNPHTAIISGELSDLAVSWLDRNESGADRKPFFLFLHYFDPHFLWMDHQDQNLTGDYKGQLSPATSIGALFKLRKQFTPEDVEFLKNLYREEIAFTDRQVGRVVEKLRSLGLEENTLIVLTADHGEEFMEHKSLTHGRSLYDEVLHVPLIFYLSEKIKPRRFDVRVDLLDIMPTILDLSCEHAPDPAWEGRSLMRLMLNDNAGLPPRNLFSELSYVSAKGRKISPDLISVRSGRYKLIRNRRRKTYALYDIESDPGEKMDISGENSKVVEELAGKIRFLEEAHARQERALSNPGKSPEAAVSEEEVKKLKSLGYF